MFRQQDATLLRQASDVLRQVPDLADPNKAGAHADPFVVALAFIEHERGQSLLFEYSCVVVSHEGKSKGRRRIADACSHFGLECIILPTLFYTRRLELLTTRGGVGCRRNHRCRLPWLLACALLRFRNAVAR
jgi:hypothetical protein